MLTEIKTIDEYLKLIGGSKGNIVAIWETGSYLEGISDEFSDRDFIIIWSKEVPNAEKRIQAAKQLGFVVHEIKDVFSINRSFDMFSDGTHMINIGHVTKEKAVERYEAFSKKDLPRNLEEILMSIYALKRGKVYYQKDGWVDKLIKKTDLTSDVREKIAGYYSVEVSQALKLLQKAAHRNDPIQFIHYLEKILRSLQIIYLIKNDKPVVSSKFFEKRFASIESGEISKLIREMGVKLDMNNVYAKTRKLASSFEVEQSEKYTA